MSRGAVTFWSWTLAAAMAAIVVCPRLLAACRCEGVPAGVQATEVQLDACCDAHAASAPTAPAENDPAPHPDDERVCSCELACCGVVRPVLAPGTGAVPGFIPAPTVDCSAPPVLARMAPGFPGDLFRPPRA